MINFLRPVAWIAGHHQRQLQHACGLGQGHDVVLQLTKKDVTHPAVQADLVIDEYNGSIFAREALGKLICGHRSSSKISQAVSVLLSAGIAKTRHLRE